MKKNLINYLIVSILLLATSAFAQSNCETTLDGVCVSENAIVHYQGVLSSPPVSTLGSASQYFDPISGKLQCSEAGGAYGDCIPTDSLSLTGDLSVGGDLTVSGTTQLVGIASYVSTHGTFTDDHMLVDKEYVDEAVTAINVNYYMLDTDSGVVNYKDTSIDIPGEAQATASSLVTASGTYIQGWISPSGGSLTTLVSGLYDMHIHASVDAVLGNKKAMLYWEMYEYKADTSEVLIVTSEDSDQLTIVESDYDIHAALESDYSLTAGSRVIGKVYVNLTGSGGNPTVTLYYLGTELSNWNIPSNTEVLSGIFVPFTGASKNVDLGVHSLTADNLIVDAAINAGAGTFSGNMLVAGTIGVGTTTPGHFLVVDTGSTDIGGYMGVRLGNDNRFIKLGNPGGDVSHILVDDNDSIVLGQEAGFNTDGSTITELLWVKREGGSNHGLIGVGKVPTYELDVRGDIYSEGSIFALGDIDVGGFGDVILSNGDVIIDNDANELFLGGEQEFELYHNGTDSYIVNNSGDIIIDNSLGSGNITISGTLTTTGSDFKSSARKCGGWFEPADADKAQLWSFQHVSEVTSIDCTIEGGTSVYLTGGDAAGNNFEGLTCPGTDTTIINADFIASEKFMLTAGTVTGTVNSFLYCIDFDEN